MIVVKNIRCPNDNARLFDSSKELKIVVIDGKNEHKADIILKCKKCKTIYGIKVIENT